MINNEDQVAHSRHALADKGSVFSPFNVEDSIVLHGKDEEWRSTPLHKPRGLHNGAAADPVAVSTSVETAGQDGVVVDVVKRDDERLDRAGTLTDRVTAQAYPSLDDVHAVIFTRNLVSKEPVVINIGGPGEDSMSYDHIVIDV